MKACRSLGRLVSLYRILKDYFIRIQFNMSQFDKYLEESVHGDVIPGAVLYAQDKDGQSRRSLNLTSNG